MRQSIVVKTFIGLAAMVAIGGAVVLGLMWSTEVRGETVVQEPVARAEMAQETVLPAGGETEDWRVFMLGLRAEDYTTYTDTGKDSGQKLMDVSYRNAAGPCNLPRVAATIRARSTRSHPTDIMGTGLFTKPLAPSPV